MGADHRLESYWVAAVTEPANEYAAKVDLERYGLHPYLP
jgi:hypothetical protein